MRKKITYLLLFTLAITGIYVAGPAPTPPTLPTTPVVLTETGPALEAWVNEKESQVPHLKPGNEAKIVWYDSLQKSKTPYSFVYIHGFSASGEEGAPVHRQLAQRYQSNLFIARLAGHGQDLGDQTFETLTADQLLASAEEALAVGKQLGEKVIIIGTSMGGALTTYLAAHHPEIFAVVLYSPCIEIYDPNAALIDNPWGLHIARAIKNSPFNDIPKVSDLHAANWTLHYRLEGVQALQNFLTQAMVPSTFEKVKCPVFMGYYYRDEENQDKVVSVPAMLRMFEQLGSPVKTKQAFPTTGNHVMASYILSKDYPVVARGTEAFLDPILGFRPAP